MPLENPNFRTPAVERADFKFTVPWQKWLSVLFQYVLRRQVVATLNFPNTLAQASSDLVVTVNGVNVGDGVQLGVPPASVPANSCYTAWVSDQNEVTVRFNNYSSGAQDPTEDDFVVMVTKQ